MTLDQIRGLLHMGQQSRALSGFAEYLAYSTPSTACECVAAADLAAELGLVEEALKLLEQADAKEPGNPLVLRELADLHLDRGDMDAAEHCRARLSILLSDHSDEAKAVVVDSGTDVSLETPAIPFAFDADDLRGDALLDPFGPDATTTIVPLLQPEVGDLVRFLHLFSGREEVHARQWADSRGKTGYAPVRQPITPELLRAHLHGGITMGVYPIRIDGTVAFLALDLDIRKKAIQRVTGDPVATRQLRQVVSSEGLRLKAALEKLGLPTILEDSGYKGRHLWGFFSNPLPASLAYRFGLAIVRHLTGIHRDLALEVFPKQARIQKGGLGNLIKLPLGIHRLSGRRGLFLGDDGQPVKDPWAVLRDVNSVDQGQVLSVLEQLKNRSGNGAPPVGQTTTQNAMPSSAASTHASLEKSASPPFTRGHLETDPTLIALFSGCAVLADIVETTLTTRRINHHQRVILRHSLGHLEQGARAANYLFSQCPEVGKEDLIGRIHRGHPISCPRIRSRIPELTARVACNCVFPSRPDHYPTPLLHLNEAQKRGDLAPDGPGGKNGNGKEAAVEAARAYTTLLDKQKRVADEITILRQHLVEILSLSPTRSVRVPGGTWQVVSDEGLPVLQWTPVGSPDGSDAPHTAEQPQRRNPAETIHPAGSGVCEHSNGAPSVAIPDKNRRTEA